MRGEALGEHLEIEVDHIPSSEDVWIARADQSVEARNINTGLTNGQMVEVLEGLRLGEKVVTKGSLFVDRAAVGS